ncbi:MAG: carbohydrate kinase [Firmicutes bacterium HGW-Firmicutes-16]|nr:MAG: carbohydrate kinase [Firmicutes bacterium HGW-Firmicutes-16]
MSMFDITAFGELLIDFTQVGVSPSGMVLFEQNPGGAPANVLACAAKLGQKTAFIGKIGADMQGEFLRKTLQNAKINTNGLVIDENFFTTLAFVSLNENGERSFSFARKPGADTQICWEEVDISIVKNSRIFHFGSLSLTDSPARETTLFALAEAKKAGCIISYDPNYRPLLWKNEAEARQQMRSVLPYVDMIKLSDEETALLTDYTDSQKAAKHLIDNGIQLAAVTLGKSGALIATKDGFDIIPGFNVDAIDTTGAGDAFWGALLYSVEALGKKISEIDFSEIRSIARFANAAAALCVTKRGAIPSMPVLCEIKELLKTQ